MLYLTEENVLRDCLTLQDSSGRQSDAERHLADKLQGSEVVQDYVKLSKRRQVSTQTLRHNHALHLAFTGSFSNFIYCMC